MDERPAIVIEADGYSLRLTPRLTPHFPPRLDEVWVRTAVDVDAGAFTGRFNTLVEPGDFGYARDVLRALYDQAGQTERMGFTFTEGTVGMSFEPTRLGHLHCTVELAPNMAGPFLRFEMEAAQSYLPQWIASFDAVLPLLPRN